MRGQITETSQRLSCGLKMFLSKRRKEPVARERNKKTDRIKAYFINLPRVEVRKHENGKTERGRMNGVVRANWPWEEVVLAVSTSYSIDPQYNGN